MLFGKKKCPQCGSEIDKGEYTCPACRHSFEGTMHQNAMTWIAWPRQLGVFLIGSSGLTIAALILTLIFRLFSWESETIESLWINFGAYLLVLGGGASLLYCYWKGLLKSFKRWLPYLLGLAGFVAIIFFNIVYNAIVNLIRPIESNANEELVDSYILMAPVVSFFIIVLMGPIAEELTYRVGLFSLLSRIHVAVGYVLTGLIFAFIHFDWSLFVNFLIREIDYAQFLSNLVNELLNIPLYIFAGLTFCFLYHKWGLAASLTAHITNNLFSYIFILLGSVIHG